MLGLPPPPPPPPPRALMNANLRKLFYFPEAHFIVLVIVITDIGPTSSPGLFRERGWHGVSH